MRDSRKSQRGDKATVAHYTATYPSSVRKASDVAKRVAISEGRLLELANSGHIPHYRIDGGEPLFSLGEVRAWVGANLCVRNDGAHLPIEVRPFVALVACDLTSRPPNELAMIKGLLELQTKHPPSIYFMCLKEKVVYIGQSIKLAHRVGTHDYEHDRVYFLPVPESVLLEVESALIRIMRPIHNSVHVLSPVRATDLDVAKRYVGLEVTEAPLCP
jgi:hypothetical protein